MKAWLKNTPTYYFVLGFLAGLWGVVTWLSLVQQLTQFNLQLFTILLLVPFAYIIGYKARSVHREKLVEQLKKYSLITTFGVLIAVLLLVQGFFSAPNTTDAMTYHLPRAFFWLSEKTVYPDSIYTQNDFLSPFGDYLLLVNLSLFNSDRLLFLNQFLAGLGSLYLVYILSFKLFKNSKYAWQSVFWVAVLPALALQMVNTQVEILTTFLILLSTVILVDFVQKQTLLSTFTFPIAISLALLNKTTAIFFVPIWLLYLSMSKTWKKISLKNVVAGKAGVISGIVILSFFLLQNLKLFHQPLGMLRFNGEVYSMTNEKVSVGTIVSNTIRNSFIHLPVPIGTQPVQASIELIHQFFNQPINDPKTTWVNQSFRVQKIIFPQEDLVGNPLHLLLIFICTIWVLTIKNKPRELVWIMSGFWLFWIGFSIVLKWQPWHSRLHLPIFFFTALIFPIMFAHHQKLQKLLLLLSAGLSVLIILGNTSHPYIPYSQFENQLKMLAPTQENWPKPFFRSTRTEQYFSARPEWVEPFEKSRLLIGNNQIRSVCFELMDGFEYPFWAILKPQLASHVSTSHDCMKSQAELQLATSDLATPYVEHGFSCFPTKAQDKFLCIKGN